MDQKYLINYHKFLNYVSLWDKLLKSKEFKEEYLLNLIYDDYGNLEIDCLIKKEEGKEEDKKEKAKKEEGKKEEAKKEEAKEYKKGLIIKNPVQGGRDLIYHGYIPSNEVEEYFVTEWTNSVFINPSLINNDGKNIGELRDIIDKTSKQILTSYINVKTDNNTLENTYSLKGVEYYKDNKLEKALECFLKSYNLGEKGLSCTCYNLASIYATLKKDDESLFYHMKAIEYRMEESYLYAGIILFIGYNKKLITESKLNDKMLGIAMLHYSAKKGLYDALRTYISFLVDIEKTYKEYFSK